MSEQDQPREEITSLNADELDIEDLENVAGGDCGTFSVSCGTYNSTKEPSIDPGGGVS